MIISTILRLNCSPKGAEAYSARFADELTGHLLKRGRAQTVVRDLAAVPPAFVDADFARDMNRFHDAATAAGSVALTESEMLIREVEEASCIVIATPMHNFTVPAVLKAWIDQVVRVGRTFETTPAGKVGFLADRPVYVVVSSGGRVTGHRARQPDFLTPYVTAVLATIGLHDIRFFYLEAVSRDAATRDAAFDAARAGLAWIA